MKPKQLEITRLCSADSMLSRTELDSYTQDPFTPTFPVENE